MKFHTWCESKGYDSIHIGYKTFLEYVNCLKKPRRGKTFSQKSIKHTVGALKVYFNYLVEENSRMTNPISNLNIRGIKKSLRHDLLSIEELEELYFNCPTEAKPHHFSSKAVAIRNKVITGLFVYQGLDVTSLKPIQTGHININKGEIYIPSTRKTNSRTLPLQSQQMLPLLRYLEDYRPLLQEKTENYSDALIEKNSSRQRLEVSIEIVIPHSLRNLNNSISVFDL